MLRFLHMDADESAFFARSLEHVKAKAYEIKYANLKARNLIPVSMEANPGAAVIVYQQYDQVGMAKVIASYADDLPRVDILGKEYKANVRSLADAYGYNLQEIRSAKMAGVPLAQRKANAAKRAILAKENKIAFLGDSESGLYGLINHPNISTTTIPADGTGATTTWSTKTPTLILRDMHKLANYVVENTKEVEVPDTLLLPTEQFNLIASTPMSTDNGKTILQMFLDNSRYVKNVESVNELNAAGAGSTDRMVVYRRDPDALTLEIPQDFEQLETEQRNLEYITPCHSRCAGVIIYYPLSVAYADGI